MAKKTEQIGGIEWVKYDWKAFKFVPAFCGPKLTISDGGLVVKHTGPNGKIKKKFQKIFNHF
jgi:hypothetical protein